MSTFAALDQVAEHGDPSDPEFSDMADFPSFNYTKADVKAASRVIGNEAIWTPETEDSIRCAFSVANNWRQSHAFPMNSIRISATWHVRHLQRISAGRLKRMSAIRAKLRRIPHLRLDNLQDIGGCRIVLPEIEHVQYLSAKIREKLRHELRKESPYILEPKDDGYRSHHMIWLYVGKGRNKVFDGRSIELQIRTSLQHAWATAIEAVGTFRNEALKSGEGSPEWRRLMTLMSADFCDLENCPTPDKTPDRPARRKEICDLAKSLDAVATLETVNRVFDGPDIPLAQGYRPNSLSHQLQSKDAHIDNPSPKPHYARHALL